MTLMQRIHRAGQGVEPGWEDRDVERVWQSLKRKRRRRSIAARAGVAAVATTAIAVWVVVLVLGHRDGGVEQAARSAPASHRDETLRFADGSIAVPRAVHQGSLAVVENTPHRVVVILTKGGAQFDVVHRAERVFAVRAGEVTVSVLGTAFSMERVADRVGVAVTRGAVRVDWGTGTRRLVAGEDGWFPPIVTSPPVVERRADVAAKETRPILRDGARADLGATPKVASNEGNEAAEVPAARVDSVTVFKAAPPPEPLVTTTPPAVSTTVPSASTSAQPAAESRDRSLAGAGETTDAAKLLAEADRARLAGRFEEGASLLQRLVREYPADPLAPLAAFSLGRLLLGELGRPAEAARAFALSRALAPGGPLADDALAREAEARARSGDADRARARR